MFVNKVLVGIEIVKAVCEDRSVNPDVHDILQNYTDVYNNEFV